MDEHTGFGTHGRGHGRGRAAAVAGADLVLATSRPLFEKIRRPRRTPCGSRTPPTPSASRPAVARREPARGAAAPGDRLLRRDRGVVRRGGGRRGRRGVTRNGRSRSSATRAGRRRSRASRAGRTCIGSARCPTTKLPGYVAGFDVCTIPFQRTPLTEATNPVKLYEYLATGKPIVARRLPELEPFARRRRRSTTPAPISSACARDAPSARTPRRASPPAAARWPARTRGTSATRRSASGSRIRAAARDPPHPDTAPAAGAATATGTTPSPRASSEIRRLDGVVREQKEGIDVPPRRGRGPRADHGRARRGARARARAGARDLRGAGEAPRARRWRSSSRWEKSRLGRSAGRPRGRVRAARPALTAPGTPLFAVGRRLLPRPLAQWLRRVVAPVASSADGRRSRRPPSRRAAGARTPSRRGPPGPLRRRSSSRSSTGTSASSGPSSSRPSSAATATASSTSRRRSSSRPAARLGPDAEGRARRGAPHPLAPVRSTSTAGTWTPADLDALGRVLRGARARTSRSATRSASSQIPFWAPLAERLRERLGWRVVYDCMDEWTNFPGFGAERSRRSRSKLVRGADATVVSADRLVEKWKATAPRLVLARNGDGRRPLPRALRAERAASERVRHPVIGYYGALASWVDVPLLTKIARRASGGDDRPRRRARSTWTSRPRGARRTSGCSASAPTTRCRSCSGTSTPA